MSEDATGQQVFETCANRAWEIATYHSITAEEGLVLDSLTTDQKSNIEFGIYCGLTAAFEILDQLGLIRKDDT